MAHLGDSADQKATDAILGAAVHMVESSHLIGLIAGFERSVLA